MTDTQDEGPSAEERAAMDPAQIRASITGEDIRILALTIFGEARGESWIGKLAVGYSVRHRVETDIKEDKKPDWWGEGYEAVCLKPKQYSCWNSADPNRPLLDRLTVASDSRLRECLAAAACAMFGIEPDPINGARHYIRAGSPLPPHLVGRRPDKIIGNHQFYEGLF